jgi:hypothetical protein
VFVYAVTVYFAGFLLFLLGLSLFMHRENRKFGDNQFTMKLLPAFPASFGPEDPPQGPFPAPCAAPNRPRAWHNPPPLLD